MQMTLNDAIEHLEEELATPEHWAKCNADCKREHEQLLEWLKDYSTLKENVLVWKSVKEQMPENGIMVLCTICGSDIVFPFDTPKSDLDSRHVTTGFYSPEDGGWCDADGFPMVCKPDFWTEMPKPCKEEIK